MKCPECNGVGHGIVDVRCYGGLPIEIDGPCYECDGTGELLCDKCGSPDVFFCGDCDLYFCAEHLVKDFNPEKPICADCGATKEERQAKEIKDLERQIVLINKENKRILESVLMRTLEQSAKTDAVVAELSAIKKNPFKNVSDDQIKEECEARGIRIYEVPKKEVVFRRLEM